MFLTTVTLPYLEEPKIKMSCVCCTYGKPKVLEESIRCFLDQKNVDTRATELIVINDNPRCQFYLDSRYNNVRIINLTERFSSLGEKRNAFREYINGEYVFVWDDDDLFGLNRLSDGVTNFDPDYDILKPRASLFSVENSDYRLEYNVFHSSACIKKSAYFEKPYSNLSVGEDLDFEMRCRVKVIEVGGLVWYVYRWGNTFHISGLAGEGQENAWKAMENYVQNLEGDIEIVPQYYKNYWKDIYDYYVVHHPEYVESWYTFYYSYLRLSDEEIREYSQGRVHC